MSKRELSSDLVWLDSVELGREDEEIINIYCHYNKCPIVILDKDTVIEHALSET